MVMANTVPVDIAAPENAAWASQLQGNILNGHGRDHTANVFVVLPEQPDLARAVLLGLSRHITSAVMQEAERRAFRQDREAGGGTFGTLLLAASAYRKAGYTEDELNQAFTEDQDGLADTPFLKGAKAAVGELADPDPTKWEAPYRNIDALLLLADSHPTILNGVVATLQASLAGKASVYVERGKALRRNGEGIEHFGYLDGRSQPLYTTWDFEREADGSVKIYPDGHWREKEGGKTDVYEPFAPLTAVLVDDLLAGNAHAWGSYFVFRKLEQNVRGFSDKEEALAKDLVLPKGDEERAGAMVVGRFEDGTPVVVHQAAVAGSSVDNNFDYSGDPQGMKCPFQGHVRKTNPRGERSTPESHAARRITRRGIPYGEREDMEHDLPGDGVGLLFMCYQASIPNQFGFMQKLWANNDAFVEVGTGVDPIVGQGGGAGNHTWHEDWGGGPTKIFDFRGFVRMRGGEFFFAPSLAFFRALALRS